MQLSRLLLTVALLVSPICLLATTWLYLYPLFDASCGFPVPPPNANPDANQQLETRVAPFRLLALGDPQLEGDSSLPDPHKPIFPSVRFLWGDLQNAGSWRRRRQLLHMGIRDVVKRDLWKLVKGWRKRIDLWGNDWYLAHIVRTLRWASEPSHVAVLGDLLGSQWISDGEFEERGRRYWGRVMRGLEKIGGEVMGGEGEGEGEEKGRWESRKEVLGEDEGWKRRVINIAGNHDVGYAGDLDENRVERFEKAFGRTNWDIWFELPPSNGSAETEEEEGYPPALRLVILNSMNLDTPALSDSLQRQSYDFLNHVITTARPVTDKTHATILLTHIPLHKESGICVDDPFFDFFQTGSGVKEQNMLSEHASGMILQGVFGLNGNPHAEGAGLGRHGIIINGHDHEGCDAVHYIPQDTAQEPDCLAQPAETPEVEEAEKNDSEPKEGTDTDTDPPPPETFTPNWHAYRLPTSPSRPRVPLHPLSSSPPCSLAPSTPHIRELTLRSMMGDFSGYAGFLSAWFDADLGERGEWVFGFSTCGVGVQHWWWGVHILDLVVLVM
ncbi:hypothetical protein P154DRAFT_463169, partial [Amniculicola lignicola CBS 123094]